MTATDIARGKVVEPGWYKLRIANIQSQQASDKAKNPGSDGVSVDFFIQDNPAYSTVPLNRYFSLTEKARGFLKPFLVALGFTVPEEGGEWDLDESLIDRELMGYIKNDTYEGRLTNKVEDFRPLVS